MANNNTEIPHKTYPIVAGYIVKHGLSKINTPAMFIAIIRRVIVAMPDTTSSDDIRAYFNEGLESLKRD